MNVRRQFDLDIYKLSNKKHYYEFDINDLFFESFEDSIIKKGKLHVNLTLDKSETMIIGDFRIAGAVELICDRSLDEFDFEINTEEQLIFKYGNEFAEISEEIILIPRETHKLDVSQYIYEFIGLSVPMKKLHPRFQEEAEEDEESETLLIYSTGTGEPEEEETDTPDSDENDIWNKLRNLNNN